MWRDLRLALQLVALLPALILTRPLDDTATASVPRLAVIHTVVPSECNTYHNWQVLGQFWSWKKVGSPGMFSRIACCDMSTLKGQQSVNPYQVYYTETQRDPEGIGDDYIPYNKPYGVMSWLENVQPAGDYFLIVDPDMTFHRWFTIEELGVGAGWGAAQGMWYMKELNQFIAKKLLPSQQGSMGTIKRQLLHRRADVAFRASGQAHQGRTNRPLKKKRLLPAQAAQLKIVDNTHASDYIHHPELQLNLANNPHDGGFGARHGSRKLQQGSAQSVVVNAQAQLQLADEVGEIYVYAAADLKRIAPLWWDYTKKMRSFHEKYAQELPEDTPIRRPWIAEMYAIALGAAQMGVRHRSYNNIVMHPPNAANALNKEGPNMLVSHYAWNAEVPSMNWKWNKHAFKTNWSALACPPWNLDQQFSRTAWGEFYNGSHGGLFPHPPLPSELINKAPGALFQDLANTEMVAMLNEGFCELHHKPYCPPSEELTRECGKATRVMQELAQFYRELANGSSIFCLDTNAGYCAKVQTSPKLAELCQESPAKDQCHRTCGLCHKDFDSSKLVWYNQQHTQASDVTHSNQDTSSSSLSSSSAARQKLADLSGKEGIGAGTATRPLDDLDDPPDRRLTDAISEETARPRTYLDGIVDTMLQQQADVKTATTGQDAHQLHDAARQAEGRKSVIASMLAHIASMSEGDQLSVSADGTPIKGLAAMPSHGNSLKQGLGNPLCFGLVLLCLVLALCVLWLARMQSRRRKSAAQ